MSGINFTPDAARRIIRGIKKVEQTSPSPYGRRGSLSRYKDTVFFTNNSGETAPKGGIIWLYEREETGVYNGDIPDGSDIAFFGIIGEEIPDGEVGNAFTSGTHKVLVESQTYIDYATYLGTYLSTPLTSDWEAEPPDSDSLERLLVVGQDDESPYLWVNISDVVSGEGGGSGDEIEIRCVAKWAAYKGD